MAVIKNTAPISAKPWERKEGGGKDGGEKERQTEGKKEREEEIGESQRSKKKKKAEGGEKFSAPFGHGLCWTLINGYCSP